MKTTIKSFIVICALGIAGLSNVSASVNCESKGSKLISANQTLAELSEKMPLFDADINGSIDYQKEAQMVTRWIADVAEAKATQQLIDRNLALVEDYAIENNNDTTDFRKEAQLETKAIADREEATAIQKLVDEGKIAESR